MAAQNLDSADLKAVGYQGLIREDVMDRIWDISKIPLPLTDLIGVDDADQSYCEWTEDSLAAPNTSNAVVDGSDQTGNNTVVGQRNGNHSQESVKVVQVSTRARSSNTIGRSDELSYQVMRRQQELRRDVEAIMLTGQASIADDGNAIPGTAGGLAAWITTTVSRGVGGLGAGFSTSTGLVSAVVDGTKRALTETLVRDMVEGIYQEGGDPTVFMTVPALCRKFSEYLFTSSARVATLYSDQGKSSEKATALGSVNVFVTDFGTLMMYPNRLQQFTGAADAADVFILDPSYIRQAFLTGYRTEPLAKTGLSDKRLMCVDWTIKVLTEKSIGLIADVDIAVPVTL
jgi:hypothetical protein